MSIGGRVKKSDTEAAAEDTNAAELFDHADTEGAEPSAPVSYTRRRTPMLILLVLVLLLFCFAMISPLKSCVIGKRDYIGSAAAASIALEDSGLSPSSAEELRSDMIMLDGEAYYKVQFEGTVTEYRYIIDARSGDIIMQTFYHIDTDD